METTLFILGVNHRTAPVAVRERLAFSEEEVASALKRLKQKSSAIGEAALLSTCNRVEIIAVTSDPARAGDEIARFLASDREVEPASFSEAYTNSTGAMRCGICFASARVSIRWWWESRRFWAS